MLTVTGFSIFARTEHPPISSRGRFGRDCGNISASFFGGVSGETFWFGIEADHMTVGGILVSRPASAGLVQPGVHLLAPLRYAAMHPLSFGPSSFSVFRRRPSVSFRVILSRRLLGASTRRSGIQESTQRSSSFRPVVSMRNSTPPSGRFLSVWLGCHWRSEMETASLGSKSSRIFMGFSPPAIPKACLAWARGIEVLPAVEGPAQPLDAPKTRQGEALDPALGRVERQQVSVPW